MRFYDLRPSCTDQGYAFAGWGSREWDDGLEWTRRGSGSTKARDYCCKAIAGLENWASVYRTRNK